MAWRALPIFYNIPTKSSDDCGSFQFDSSPYSQYCLMIQIIPVDTHGLWWNRDIHTWRN